MKKVILLCLITEGHFLVVINLFNLREKNQDYFNNIIEKNIYQFIYDHKGSILLQR